MSTPPLVFLDEVIAEDFTIVREQHTCTIMCVRSSGNSRIPNRNTRII